MEITTKRLDFYSGIAMWSVSLTFYRRVITARVLHHEYDILGVIFVVPNYFTRYMYTIVATETGETG